MFKRYPEFKATVMALAKSKIGTFNNKGGRIMKKYLILTVMSVMTAFACNKVEPQAEEPTSFTYNFTIGDKPSFDGQTRAVKTSWENGDKIYVVFDDQMPSSLTDFLILEYSNGSWNAIQQPSASNQPKEEGGTLDALYYANPNPTPEASGSVFNFNNSTTTDGHFLFTYANNALYSISESSLEASLNLVFPGNNWNYFVQICVTGFDPSWRFTVTNGSTSFRRVSPIWKDGSFDYQARTYPTIANANPLSMDGTNGYVYSIVGSNRGDDQAFGVKKGEMDSSSHYKKTFTKKIEGPAAIRFAAPSEDVVLNATTTNGWTRIY